MIVLNQQVTSGWKHFQARFAEWLNAAILFAWGFYIIMHPGMMTNKAIAAMWEGLLVLAPEQAWGLVALLTGFMRLGALYVNGVHHRTPTIRLATSFISGFVFVQIAAGLWNGGAPNTGIVVYSALVIADIYSAFRASADVTFVAKARSDVKAESKRAVSNATHS